MRILVSGSHGLIGSALLPGLIEEGHEPLRLVRCRAGHPARRSIVQCRDPVADHERTSQGDRNRSEEKATKGADTHETQDDNPPSQAACSSHAKEKGPEQAEPIGAEALDIELQWNPERGDIDQAALGRIDVVVHLAGENVASGRWTPAKKRRLWESRVRDTRQLCEALAACPTPPKTLLAASGVGIYGDGSLEDVRDQSGRPAPFLAELCRQWEAATEPAREVMRVVNMRFGVVLSGEGGALTMMVPTFRRGLGAPLGGGRQQISWVALADVVRAISFLIAHEEIQGPVNVTSPNPVSNAELTTALNERLRRPWHFLLAPLRIGVPRFALRLLLGEMADEMLLSSIHATPDELLSHGFQFKYSRVEDVLGAIFVDR